MTLVDQRYVYAGLWWEPHPTAGQLAAARVLGEALLERYDRVVCRPNYGYHDRHTAGRLPRVPSKSAGVLLHVRDGQWATALPVIDPELLAADPEERLLWLHEVHCVMGRDNPYPKWGNP